MVNWAKWGLIGAAVVAVVIFRDQIKGALAGAGTAIGEGVGGAAGGFVTGAVRGVVEPFLPPQGADYDAWSRRNLPSGVPGLFDLFNPSWWSGQTPAAAGGSQGRDPIAARDPSNDPAITPYNREQVAKLESSVAKNVTRGGFSQQAKETALTFVKYGAPVKQAEEQARTFMQAYRSTPNTPHAQRVRDAQAATGTTVTPLALFRIYKAKGMSNTEAMRAVRERIA